MQKKFYFTAVFFTAMSMVMGLYHGLLPMQIHTQVFYRQSYLSWIIVSSMINIIMLLIWCKYYQYKKYRVASGTLVLVIIATLISFAGMYVVLTIRGMAGFYRLTQVIYLAIVSIHFISLIFSKARERRWLQVAGITGTCFQLILLPMIFINRDNTSFHSLLSWIKISEWAIPVSQLSLLFFIANFISEMRLLKTASGTKTIKPYEKFRMAALGILTILPVFYAGLNLANKKEISPTYITESNEGDITAAHFFEARNYISSSGDTMRYRLMKPLDYDPQKKYPILVCLHHGGGKGTDNIRQVAASPVARLMELYDNRKKYPAFLFVPQCPTGNSWGNVPGEADVDDLLFETIASLEKEFSIDSNRRYVTGESLGGFGTWHLLCARPNMFAAGIAVSGGGDPALAKNIVNVPVWAFHGAKDKNVPVRFDRDMIAAIKKAGGHPKYTEYPDRAHDPWDKAVKEPGLFDWFFAQKRN